MTKDYSKLITSLIGLIVTLIAFAGILLDLTDHPQQLRIFSLIGYAVFSGGIIWFAFKSTDAPQVWRWVSLGVLYLGTIPFFIWVGTWPGVQSNAQFTVQTGANRLITHYDFEGTDDGWSKVVSLELLPDLTTKSQFPRDNFFPGSMSTEVTTDYALTGQNSLKVITSVNVAGDFKSYLYREGTFTAYGVTIYVLAPDSTAASSISYIQLCVPSHDWVCSDGTQLVPGEWIPLTIDLSQPDNDGVSLAEQKLTELAVQWRFITESGTSVKLYFDSAEFFSSGS